MMVKCFVGCWYTLCISDFVPTVVISSTYIRIITLYSGEMKTQESKEQERKPNSARALDSLSNHASGACLSPYNDLSKWRTFPSRPIPGGGIIQTSSCKSPLTNADLMSAWDISRPRSSARAIVRYNESYLVTGASVSSCLTPSTWK